MAPLFTSHYLLIPSDTNEAIKEIDIPFGITMPEMVNHITKIREALGGQAKQVEMMYSDDIKQELLGKHPRPGFKFTSYEANLLGDPSLPLNNRAQELLLTPPHQPLHGPVLLSIMQGQLGPMNIATKTGSGKPTVAHLQSEEWRSKRRAFLRLMDEKGVESVSPAGAGIVPGLIPGVLGGPMAMN